MTTPKRLFSPTQLGVAAATLYTCPVNQKVIITKLTFTNTSALAATVTIYIIPNGGAASDTNTISKTRALAPGEAWDSTEAENHILEAGDFIQALASAATSISAMGSGLIVT